MAQKTAHDSETPAHGQQVIVGCAFIYRLVDGRPQVFLAKRADTKKFYPGVYEVPGGHIDFGEDIVDGVKREVREEIGKDIVVGDPFSVFTYLNEVKGAHAIEVAYFAQFDDDDNIVLNPEDHSAYGWFYEDQDDEYLVNRSADDPEKAVIARGFRLLAGQPLNF